MQYIYYQDSPVVYQTEEYKKAFIGLYQKIYSAAPFWEKFSADEVEKLYDKYTNPNSILYFVMDEVNGKLIGFAAAIPLLLADEEIQKLLGEFVQINKTYQNTEIAVDPAYRGQGIGSYLVDLRLEKIRQNGYTQVLMRTTSEGSMSAGIYLKRGFKQLPVTQQVQQARSVPTMTDIDERVFYLKTIS